MITLRDLIEQLAAEGRLPPDTSARVALALSSPIRQATPWYIHALVGVGSLIAAGLFIVVLSLLGALNGSTPTIVTGLVLCALAVALRFAVDRITWLHQVPLALAIAGAALFSFGVASSSFASGSDIVNVVLLTASALQLALLALYRDRLHRFLSTWLIAGSLAGLLLNNDLRLGMAVYTAGLGWAAALVWERESAFVRRDALARPIAYGLVVGLFTCLLILVGDQAPLDWPASIGLAAALAYVAWSLLDNTPIGQRLAALAAVALLLVPAWETPGMLGAALVLIVGFSRGARPLIGLGGLFLAGFIIFYYYSLDISLLLKSFYLAAAGLLLLGARAVLARAVARAPQP